MKSKIDRVFESRLAQATDKGFKDGIHRLMQAEKQYTRRTQKGQTPMTFKEKQALQAQTHAKFSQMSEAEQTSLEQERKAMWSQIPAHLQEKARKLAGR